MSIRLFVQSPSSSAPSRSASRVTAARVEPLEGRRLLAADVAAGLATEAPGDSGDIVLTPSVHAAPISDPRGDILPTYTGEVLPGMDVVAHKVTLDGDRMVFFGKMAGQVAPTQEIGALYLFGVDRGLGTPRFLGPAAPPVIGPNVTWDSILRVNPDGTGLFNNIVAGVITPLDPGDIQVNGNHFTASVPLSLMTPLATLPPERWTYNLWPRNGIGRNVQVSDLGPDDGNSPVQVLTGGTGRGEGSGAPVVGGAAAVIGGFADAERIADDVFGTADADDAADLFP